MCVLEFALEFVLEFVLGFVLECFLAWVAECVFECVVCYFRLRLTRSQRHNEGLIHMYSSPV